jgi:hypothetical protein
LPLWLGSVALYRRTLLSYIPSSHVLVTDPAKEVDPAHPSVPTDYQLSEPLERLRVMVLVQLA